MKHKVCRVPDITHEEWLEYRRTGIGGSDAATIVGLNPYSSLYYLYNDKLGLLPPKEDTEAMRQGRDLEQYVADRWMEATGKRCQRNNYMWRSTAHPFMLADIDREVVGENAGLECKTTSVYNRADLENGEIPLTYYIQCQHYMAVMGYDRMYLAVLVLNRGFYHFIIHRDSGEMELLIQAEKEFWENHILPKEPPAPDGSDATLSALHSLHPREREGEYILPLTGRAAADLRAVEELTRDSVTIKEAIQAAKARVMEEMGEAPLAEDDIWTVSWKTQTRTTVDKAKLKNLYPEIYEQVTKTTSARTFRAVRKKEKKT